MKFGKARLTRLLSPASLTARFAVYSFVCIGIMTAALWFIVSNYLMNKMLEREWELTAEMVRTEAKSLLTPYDFTAQDRKSVGPKFDALHRHVTLLPGIVRFKVYNAKGVVIWSDDKRLVGKSFPENNDLQEALKGKIIADISSLAKPENQFENDSLRRAVEVYIPIYSEDSGEVMGVFETY